MGQVWYAAIYSRFREGCPFSRLLFGQRKKISFLWLLSRINCPCQGVNFNDSLYNIQWRCLPEWMSGKVWHSFHWSAPAKTRKYKIQNTKIQRRTTKYEWMAGVGHSFRCWPILAVSGQPLLLRILFTSAFQHNPHQDFHQITKYKYKHKNKYKFGCYSSEFILHMLSNVHHHQDLPQFRMLWSIKWPVYITANMDNQLV